MLLFIVFAPLVTALLVIFGAPARRTSLLGSAATAIGALLAFCIYDARVGRIPIRPLVDSQRRLADSLLVRRGWAQPHHALSGRARPALRGLVYAGD